MTHPTTRNRPTIEKLENRTLLTSVVVNTTSDTDTTLTTLRDAITIANSSADPTTITFDPAVFSTPQTIVLNDAQLALTNTAESTTLTGPANGVSVSGNNLTRVFEIYENVTATLSNVNVLNGNSFDSDGDGTGGGIFNIGTLIFSNGNVTGNTAQAGGGGINNSNKLTLSNATLSNNKAGDHGGGLENYGARLGNATAALTNVTVTGNSVGNHGGAGIASDSNGLTGTTTLVLNNVTVTDNAASGDGGGILLDSSTTDTAMTNVTLVGNTATGNGGGLAELGGAATLSRATVAGNLASGISLSRGGGLSVAGTLSVSDSTISGNISAYYGGGIDVEGGTLNLVDDTLTNNAAGGVGGLNNGQTAVSTLEGVTIVGNSTTDSLSSTTVSPGGIANYPDQSAVLIISNSIVAGNTNTVANGNYADAAAQFTSLGHNLIGSADNSTGWLPSDLTGTQTHPLNPGLSAFADNGGPTKTLLPQSGSPAIAAGSLALIPAGVQTDQRGFDRVIAGAVDIGAVETYGAVVATAASITTLTASAQTIILGGTDTFTVAVTSVDSTNPTPTGTISIYEDGNFRGAFALASGTISQVFTATKSAPNTLFTAVYSGDANYAGSTSNSLTQVYLGSSPVTGKVGRAIVPATGIIGQKFSARVPLTWTNTGSVMKGTFTQTLYLDAATVSDGGLGTVPVQLVKTSKFTTVKSGKTLVNLFATKLIPASVTPGTYHLVAKLTDVNGDAQIIALDQTIVISTPLVKLTATASAVKPSVVAVNKKATLVISITNSGNVATTGFLVISLSPSTDGISPVPGIVLTKPVIHTTIKPGKTGKYTLHIRIPAPLAAGVYYSLATVSFGDITTTAVGPQFTAG